MARAAAIPVVRGFRDILPPDSHRWRGLEQAAATIFGAYGFHEIRLAVLERTELFGRSIGEATDIVEKEMYAFPDRDGTSLALRPEGTAGVVRAYLDSGMVNSDPTARLWYAGPMFRRERPQKGRYRQFWQIGAEAFGREDPLVDAEMLVMLTRYLGDIGARNVTLRLNSLGDETCRPSYRERLRAFGEARRDALCGDCVRRLEHNPLRLLDCKVESCRAVLADAPLMLDHLCPACRTHFDAVRTLLDQERIPYAVDARIVRGLDYYCRTAFEALADGLGSQNAVAGGGRYDGLVEALGGPAVAGIGFAIGLDRLAMIVAEGAAAPSPLAVILPLDERAVAPGLALATRLRDAGVRVGLEASGRSLKALLRAADRQHATLALILGEAELNAGRATVRDLVKREDRPLAVALDAPASEVVRLVNGEAVA
jgi:histidyl-tRNA synthetase